MKQTTLLDAPLAIADEKGVWCTAYAQDDGVGLVFASFVARTKTALQAVLQRGVVGGSVGVRLEDHVCLQAGGDVIIPWHGEVGLLDPEARKRGSIRYRSVYARRGPHCLRTQAGYQAVVVHQDATLRGVQANHWAYALRFDVDEEREFRTRFLWLWSQATALPREKQGWFGTLWRLGTNLGLITPLDTFGCQGWRVDPRGIRPGGKPAWEQVLELAVTMPEIGGEAQ